MKERNLDVICMGRAAVDLYAEQIGAPLEEVSSFAKYVGGCPANIAIGSSRLGLSTAILSRVGDEAMGRFVRNTFIKEGVEVSHLHTDSKRLTGLVLLGINPPDRFPLIFYRENCADMAIDRGDFSLETFQNAKSLLITGTHCANEKIFEVTKYAAQLAKDAGCKLILDIDYRPVLWGVAGHGQGEERYIAHHVVSERLSQILPICDLIVGTEEELRVAVNSQSLGEALEALRKCSGAVIVQKRGEEGCVVYEKDLKDPTTGSPYPIKVLNVLGAGDAFMSGFLRGFLRNLSMEECCALANANGALVVSRHGCAPAMPFWAELQHYMRHPEDLVQLERMHRSMEKASEIESICFLAFDHRTHFEKLAKDSGSSPGEICYFKELVYDAIKKAQKFLPDAKLGIIVDGQYGDNVLKEAAEDSFCTARCIEESNVETLNFLNDKEAGTLLRSWPRDHVIKVLAKITSNDERNKEQLLKLGDLFEATKQTGHPLLIEFINAENSNDLTPIKETIKACYQSRIFPSWWKLPPVDDPQTWKEIEAMVIDKDPYCNGILLLGENRPMEEVVKALKNIRGRQRSVKGFAVGRTIWGEVAEDWFHGKINDHSAIDRIAKKFIHLVTAWLSDNDNDMEVSHDRNIKGKDSQGAKRGNDYAYNGPSPYFVSDSTKSGAV